jgi:hypothetical protein
VNEIRRPRWQKAVVVVLATSPWVAINVYWIRTGELRTPFWFVLINLLIAFFAFAAPAIDRTFSSHESDDRPTLPRITRPRTPHKKAA